MEADKDHLINEDNDGAYRKCPGVSNVAYVVSECYAASAAEHLLILVYGV